MSLARVIEGNCLEVLQTLEPQSVQTCVTSPPYWGLRDYGNDSQLGLEPTPEQYVENLVRVFREVRRVLRDDGTVWLNLGDSYAGGGGYSPGAPSNVARQVALADGNDRDGAFVVRGEHNYEPRRGSGKAPPGIKPKDLVGIPWMVAFALRADGWYLRSDIIWAKPNPMPESVTDRPTKAHEYLFLLAKQPRYFYDADAIREDALQPLGEAVATGQHKVHDPRGNGASDKTTLGANYGPAGRNKRSVWTVTTQPFPGAHFATFPPKLIEPCILAGSAEGDTVLDPFSGAGTTGVVALRRNRSFVGVELNPDYAEMARNRIRDDAPLLNEVAMIPDPNTAGPYSERVRP